MENLIKHIESEFTKFKKSGATNSELAFCLFGMVDSIQAQALEKYPQPVSCKKGCSHCCYQIVGMSSYETDLILDNVEFDNENKKRIKKLAKFKTVKQWATLPHNEKRCIFLSDKNECRIYKIRPFACRTYLVINDPALCDLSKGKSTVQIVDNPAVNAVYYKFLEMFSNHTGKMYELLAKKL